MRYCYVYYVFHRYTECFDSAGDPVHETKEIGLYSRKAAAEAAVARFRGLEGFSDHPDGFQIQKRRCYTAGTPSVHAGDEVYSPYHEYYVEPEDYDVVTRGRFWKEKEEALKELDEWKRDNVMKLYPEGFNVIDYTVDRDIRLWSEGFNRD